MRRFSRSWKVLAVGLCLTYCVGCRRSAEHLESFEEVMCTDMGGVTRPCDEVLANSSVLVFSPLCPICREVVRALNHTADVVAVSPQSMAYLRYYQLKIPVQFPIYKVSTDKLRAIGVASVPCLLEVGSNGRVFDIEHGIPEILLKLGKSEE